MSRRQEIVSPEGLRIDGRRAAELRKLDARLGVFTEADGSAFIQHGHSKVLCAVYGPRQPMGRYMFNDDKASVKVTFQTAFSTQKRDKKSLDTANTIKQLFENVILLNLFPRSEIDIYIQVLQVDGGILHAAINATSLALIDAGIPMIDFVSACSAGYSETNILDLNYIEESSEVPTVTIACLKSTQNVCMFEIDGKMACDNLEGVAEYAMQGCASVAQEMETWVKDITMQRANML